MMVTVVGSGHAGSVLGAFLADPGDDIVCGQRRRGHCRTAVISEQRDAGWATDLDILSNDFEEQGLFHAPAVNDRLP